MCQGWGPIAHSEGHTSEKLNGFCLLSNGGAPSCSRQAEGHPSPQETTPKATVASLSPRGSVPWERGHLGQARGLDEKQAAKSGSCFRTAAGSHNQDSSWKNVTNAAQLGPANQKHRPRGGSRDRPRGQGRQRGDNWQQGLGLYPPPSSAAVCTD